MTSSIVGIHSAEASKQPSTINPNGVIVAVTMYGRDGDYRGTSNMSVQLQTLGQAEQLARAASTARGFLLALEPATLRDHREALHLMEDTRAAMLRLGHEGAPSEADIATLRETIRLLVQEQAMAEVAL